MKKSLLIVAFMLLTAFNSVADSTSPDDKILSHIQENLVCMTTAIYHEAKGEGHLGMTAVGHVVNNRMLSKSYPSGACEIIAQRGQFPWYAKKLAVKMDESWASATSIAWDVLSGESKDPTNGATMFHSIHESPGWAKKLKVKIKNHLFY